MWLASLALLVGCSEDEEPTYLQFNGADDSLEVQVGVETVYITGADGNEVAETSSTLLTSSTGAIEIGTAEVDPSAGPIGSLHRVTVEVYDDYAASIDRVTVRTDSGERGVDEYELSRDSAGEGWWMFELESVGDEGEERTDVFTFRLYEEEATETEE